MSSSYEMNYEEDDFKQEEIASNDLEVERSGIFID